MTKVEFIKQMTRLFSSKGFLCRKNHYYKEVPDDMMIVFGLQMSQYGRYCYLEYGYCIKPISKYLPYPKYNQLNLNCGRIMTDMGKAIVFETTDENSLIALNRTIDETVKGMIDLVDSGKDELIKHYLSGLSNQSWYILGNETADYFCLPKEVFMYHFVEE